MNFNNQNQFQNQNLLNQSLSSPGLHSPVSQVHALASNPDNKVQALSYLARYQGQMTTEQYQEALADIKAIPSLTPSLEKEKKLGSSDDPMKNYKQAVDTLKNIERNRW